MKLIQIQTLLLGIVFSFLPGTDTDVTAQNNSQPNQLSNNQGNNFGDNDGTDAALNQVAPDDEMYEEQEANQGQEIDEFADDGDELSDEELNSENSQQVQGQQEEQQNMQEQTVEESIPQELNDEAPIQNVPEQIVDESIPVQNVVPAEQIVPVQNYAPIQTVDQPPPASAGQGLPQPNEFAGAPPLPGSRREMNNGEAPIEYIVQPGDTLFDICDQLMDEPHYWPKLWSHNPQIKNPHFIYPGNVLKFFTGEDGRPPYMEVVKEDDVLPVDRGDLNPEELVAQEVAIVDDQASFGDSMGPVITDEELDLGGTDQMFIESGGLYSDPSILLTVPGFIFAEKKEYSGEVIGHIEGHAMSGPDDPIIVKSLQGLNPGTVYSVIREGEYVYEPNTRDNIGYMYDFVGNIRINNKMNKDGYYTAVTIRDDMSSGIRNGDVLIPFRSTKRRIPDKNAYGREVTLNGATIIAYEWAKSVMGGEGNFVFINRGEGQLSEGDAVKLYSAYGHRASPAQKPQYPTVDVDKYNVAVARIIDVTDVAALGYIMNGEWETRLGDPAGN